MDWDKHYQSVTLLLPFDGLSDFSKSQRQYEYSLVSIKNNASVNGYGASCYFDGDNSGYSVGDPVIPRLGNFTVEAWVNPTHTDPTPRYIFANRSSIASDGRLAFNLRGTRELQLFVGHRDGDLFLNGMTPLPINIWSHVALTRESGVFRLWLNGALEAETTSTLGIEQGFASTYLGRYENAFADRQWKGYMQDVRVTALARYSSTFSPPGRLTLPVILAMVNAGSLYLKAGSVGTLSGNVTTEAGQPATKVLVISDDNYVVATIEPDAAGDWTITVMDKPHFIGYFSDGCQPVLHGPYMPDVQ